MSIAPRLQAASRKDTGCLASICSQLALQSGSRQAEAAAIEALALSSERCVRQFKRIDEIENTTTNTTVDVIGLVERVDPSATINKKDGTETTKRTLLLRDQTDRSVELTLWGEYASNPGEQLEQAGASADTCRAAMLGLRWHRLPSCSD